MRFRSVSLYWLFYRVNGRPRVVIQPGSSIVHARLKAAMANLAEDHNAAYPLTAAEVGSVLRRAGHPSLSSFAHRLAMEMGRAKPEEKAKVWSGRVGSVFQGAWPLDVELQTPTATFGLVEICSRQARLSGKQRP
jgi:hypothetical protein